MILVPFVRRHILLCHTPSFEWRGDPGRVNDEGKEEAVKGNMPTTTTGRMATKEFLFIPMSHVSSNDPILCLPFLRPLCVCASFSQRLTSKNREVLCSQFFLLLSFFSLNTPSSLPSPFSSGCLILSSWARTVQKSCCSDFATFFHLMSLCLHVQ